MTVLEQNKNGTTHAQSSQIKNTQKPTSHTNKPAPNPAPNPTTKDAAFGKSTVLMRYFIFVAVLMILLVTFSLVYVKGKNTQA